MSENAFHVRHIDHVELFVPDQYAAAAWYREIFGLQILSDFESWAAGGPLMISSDDGHTKLALFAGDPPGFRQPRGFQRVAFNVSGRGFLTFLERLEAHPVYDHHGLLAHKLEVVDHDLSFSLYFCDPYGNRFEITSYDYQHINSKLTS